MEARRTSLGGNVSHIFNETNERKKLKTMTDKSFYQIKAIAAFIKEDEYIDKKVQDEFKVKIKELSEMNARNELKIDSFVEKMQQLKRDLAPESCSLENLEEKVMKAVNEQLTQKIGNQMLYDLPHYKELRGILEEGDKDAELEVVNAHAAVVLRCPITTMPFEAPVKSNKCGHVFEANAIQFILREAKKSKKKVKCPVSGCAHHISAEQLEDDAETAMLVKRHKMQQESQKQLESDELCLGEEVDCISSHKGFKKERT